MINEQIFITESSKETKETAQNLVKSLKAGDILALYGDLGSGKTTFVQGLAKGLGIQKRIISPTFVIIRVYDSKFKRQNAKVKPCLPAGRTTTQNLKFFYHIDLYRTESLGDINRLGIMEIINNPENIVAIEWAEKIKSLLPKERIDIKCDYIDENKRKIIIKFKSQRAKIKN